jgi:drug/metabolite transporter (DMT)-like permease
VSGEALVLALAAAAVHAAWNLAVAADRDPMAMMALALPAAVAVAAVPAALTWDVDRAAIPYVAGSGALETAYALLLALAYRRADVGVVYPVARGSAPVLVLLVDAAVLGASPGAWQAAGVLLVAVGVVAVRGIGGATTRGDLALALAVGGAIAGYTLLDRRGIHHAAVLPYFELCILPSAIIVPLTVWRLQGRAGLREASLRTGLLAGGGIFGAYALVLAALRQAPAPAVAAVRETSVVMAAIAVRLHLARGAERAGAHSLAGACAVAVGVALIALG